MIATLSLQLVSCLGFVIFDALDFGLSDEEERHLSPDLERLIDMMTDAGKLLLPFFLWSDCTEVFWYESFCLPHFLLSSIHCFLRILHCEVRLYSVRELN